MATSNQKLFIWGEGVMFVNGEEAQELQEVGLNIGINTIQAPKGDGGGNITVATGQPITGRAVLGAMNPELFAVLTGASNSTGTMKRMHKETLTKATDTLTTSQTPETDTLMVIPVGANKEPLKQVASSPQVGEYSVSGTTITLNSSQPETQFNVSYFYEDSSDGQTTSFGPDDLPDEFELWASMRAKDLWPGTKGDIIINAAKCVRTSEIALGSAVGASAKPGFDFEIRVDNDGDLKVYWP